MNLEHGTVAAPPPQTLATVTDPRRLRAAFAGFATGVTVVTVGGESPHGMTANAFTSVSIDPPLVLVCVGQDARMHQALAEADSFAVTVLAGHQEPVARHFASGRRPRGLAQFATVDWVPGRCTGAPLITGALAWFECTLWGSYGGGDHSIFLGRLVSAERSGRDEPLMFFDSRFRRLAREAIQ